jgi:hypothetical protein
MNPLHATIEEFAADGYTHIEAIARDAARSDWGRSVGSRASRWD